MYVPYTKSKMHIPKTADELLSAPKAFAPASVSVPAEPMLIPLATHTKNVYGVRSSPEMVFDVPDVVATLASEPLATLRAAIA